jgi:hypothetical protein
MRIILWTAAGFLGCSVGLLFSRIQGTQQADSSDMQILRQLDLLREYQKIRPVPNAKFLNQVMAPAEPTGGRHNAP